MAPARKRPLSRYLILTLLVVIPTVAGFAHRQRSAKFDRLAAGGVRGEARLTESSKSLWLYDYEFLGGDTVGHGTVPKDHVKIESDDGRHTTGVTYLPADARQHFVGPPLTPEVVEAQTALTRELIPTTLVVLALVFVLNELRLWRWRRRSTFEAEILEGVAAAPARPVIQADLVSAVFLCILLGVNVQPVSRAVFERAFGPRPFGLSLDIVVFLATVILFAPFVWVSRHLMMVIAQAMADGAGVGRVGILVYLSRVGRTHPDLKHSQAIVAFGAVYFIALAAAWIAYTAHLGI